MASYNKYDPRLESLVIETRTEWDPDIGELSAEDRAWLAKAVHEHPKSTANIRYEREHTGFSRIITVSVADIERLYEERFSR